MTKPSGSAAQKVMIGIGILATIGTTSSLLGALYWVLDVFSLFHLQYFVLLLFSSLVLLFMPGRRWWYLLFLLPLFINFYLIAPFFIADTSLQQTPESHADPPLQIMSLNISTSNLGYAQVVELIRTREPDVIFMSEVRQDLVTLLASELGDSYPVQYAEPSRFTLGLAMLARDPAVTVETVSADGDMGNMRRRYMRADFVWNGTPVTVAGIHPLPPMRSEWAYGRDRELAVMGALARDTSHPFILVGDLNASPWSHTMRSMLRETDLRYVIDGYGVWPTWLLGEKFIGPLLGAPIDHILVSPEIGVVSYTQSGDIGSDHLPIQADVLIPAEN